MHNITVEFNLYDIQTPLGDQEIEIRRGGMKMAKVVAHLVSTICSIPDSKDLVSDIAQALSYPDNENFSGFFDGINDKLADFGGGIDWIGGTEESYFCEYCEGTGISSEWPRAALFFDNGGMK